MVAAAVDEMVCKEEAAAEDSAAAVKMDKEKPPPTIHRLSKNKIKVSNNHFKINNSS